MEALTVCTSVTHIPVLEGYIFRQYGPSVGDIEASLFWLRRAVENIDYVKRAFPLDIKPLQVVIDISSISYKFLNTKGLGIFDDLVKLLKCQNIERYVRIFIVYTGEAPKPVKNLAEKFAYSLE